MRYSVKLVHKYYREWIELYKLGAVKYTTYMKYDLAYRNLITLCPNLHMHELNRKTYQKILNEFALTHEKSTVADFHHHLKPAFVDAFEDGIIKVDPTKRAIIKGKPKVKRKQKYLNLKELQSLFQHLKLEDEINWDWFIYLIAKTGLRFAEALALTPTDFDWKRKIIIIDKAWDYKRSPGGFTTTKNLSSNRKVVVDQELLDNFRVLLQGLPKEEPIFIKSEQRVFNSTINSRLNTLCKKANVPTISIHGLRHTHASLLLFEGVSILSVSKRLGHAKVTTTQETYLHVIKELENKDNRKVRKHLAKISLVKEKE